MVLGLQGCPELCHFVLVKMSGVPIESPNGLHRKSWEEVFPQLFLMHNH